MSPLTLTSTGKRSLPQGRPLEDQAATARGGGSLAAADSPVIPLCRDQDMAGQCAYLPPACPVARGEGQAVCVLHTGTARLATKPPQPRGVVTHAARRPLSVSTSHSGTSLSRAASNHHRSKPCTSHTIACEASGQASHGRSLPSSLVSRLSSTMWLHGAVAPHATDDSRRYTVPPRLAEATATT